MSSRQQKFNKVLTNKKANLELDIKALEVEVAPYLNIDLDAELLKLSSTQSNTTIELQQVQVKITDCNARLLELETEYKSFLQSCEETLTQEKAVYNDEMERIDYIYNEWVTIMTDRQTLLKNKLDTIIEKIECLTQQRHCRRESLANYKHVKRDIRADMLTDLLTKQETLKTSKYHHEQHVSHLSMLESTEESLTSWINKYPEARLKINQDYYNWHDELTQIKSQITSTISQSNTRELQQQQEQLLLNLSADPRQNYKLLFTELDEELRTKQRQLTRVQAQLNKCRQSGLLLEKPCLQPVRNPAHNDIMQGHVNAKESYDIICKELEVLVCDKATILAELDTVSATLTITGLPAEIQHWKDRADERWTIINERLAKRSADYLKEYTATRTELRTSLNSLTCLAATLAERNIANKGQSGIAHDIELKKSNLAKLDELRHELMLLM